MSLSRKGTRKVVVAGRALRCNAPTGARAPRAAIFLARGCGPLRSAIVTLALLSSIACGVVACGVAVRPTELPEPPRSEEMRSLPTPPDTADADSGAPPALPEEPRARAFERMEACSVRVATHRFAEVPDLALVAAVFPHTSAHAQDGAALDLQVDETAPWKDCHGHPSALGHRTQAPPTVRVGSRLVADEQHGYAWIVVGAAEGVLARFRLDGDKLTATATSPDLDAEHIVPAHGLRSARVGGAEILFRPIDLHTVELDFTPTDRVHAEGWQGQLARGDADFSGSGTILTRYRDGRRTMVVSEDWSVSAEWLVVEERWWPEPGGPMLSFRRRYVLRGDELVPFSRKIPR